MNGINHEERANVPRIKVYPDKFSEQVVVVTGSASRIGEATAHLFAQQGATVVLFDINHDKLESVQKAIKHEGGKADNQLCNVSDYESVDKAIKATIEKFGKIDVLANLAGLYTFHALVNHPIEAYRRLMSINLDGSFFLTRAVMPYLILPLSVVFYLGILLPILVPRPFAYYRPTRQATITCRFLLLSNTT
jgi:NAD(P)-dependent dehydrogenase (short-subunit alcohol dehydrogenase family)